MLLVEPTTFQASLQSKAASLVRHCLQADLSCDLLRPIMTERRKDSKSSFTGDGSRSPQSVTGDVPKKLKHSAEEKSGSKRRSLSHSRHRRRHHHRSEKKHQQPKQDVGVADATPSTVCAPAQEFKDVPLVPPSEEAVAVAAKSPTLMPSAKSPTLMPSAKSPMLMPSAKSPALMPSPGPMPGGGRLLTTLRRPGCVVAFFCSCAFLQGLITNGCVNSNLATLEKRYQLRSIESGLIGSIYSVASLIVLLPVTYFGKDKNMPLMMAFGTCLMGVGSLTMALPYYVGPQYSFSHPRPDTCELAAAAGNESTQACGPSAGDLRHYKWFFWLSNFINGIGTSPYFTLGIAYLDENFPRALSSKYIAAFQASAVVGPATGFVINGYFLNYYVDQGVNPSLLGLTRDSTAWVGAWWLCFLYAGLICFAVALPVSFLPAELPDRAIVMAEKKLDEQAKPAVQQEENMWATVMFLLGIKPFIFVCFAGSAELMVASGLASFLVKMLQAQFSMTASTASTIMGSVTIPTAMVGVMLGGVVIARFQLGARAIVRLCVLVLLAPITLVTVLLFHCNNIPYRNIQYDTGLTTVSRVNASLTEACNSRCGCAMSRFNPVCGRDGYTYYSPCFAGCLREYATTDSRVYSQCLCVNHSAFAPPGGNGGAGGGSGSLNPFGTVPGTMLEIEAVRNKCPNPCDLVNIFIPMLAAIVFTTFFLSTPAVAATLRCIPDQHKSVGLGIQWTIVRAFGLIPAGAAFGQTIDASCVLWEEPCGSSQGACAIYDNKLLNRNVYFLILGLKVASLCCFALALLFLREPVTPAASLAGLPN
ncbi:solute carrier organic anion transporter family member 4A1-like [Amblyomma americanum]